MTNNCETEPEYILVCENEEEGSNRLELPTNSEDNTLGLQTLTRAFPNAHGLKFKNPATGAYRALLTDESATRFFKPAGGWQNKVFIVITKEPQYVQPPSVNVQSKSLNAVNNELNLESEQNIANKNKKIGDNYNGAETKKLRTKSDQNAKRRKLMVESDEEDDQSTDSDQFAGNFELSTMADKRLRQGHYGSGAAASKLKRFSNSSNQMIEKSARETCRNDKKKKEEIDEPECVDLIILGLPFKITEEEIRNYFTQFGNVAFVDIKKKISGNSKGFGFIRMKTFEGQIKVLNKPTHTIGGRKCQVRVPFDKNGEIKEDPLVGAKVFVGRLQEKTTVADLKKYFTEEVKKIDENASVIDVYIPKPFRAFAFVTFSNVTVAKKLIKKKGFTIDGAHLSIQSAQPKTNNQSLNSNNYNRQHSMHYMDTDPYYDYYDVPRHSNYCRDMFPFRLFPQNPRFSRFNSTNLPLHAGSGHHGSQIIASGLETLNLNNMKPEVFTAIKALISAQNHNNTLNDESQSSSPPSLMSSRGNAVNGNNTVTNRMSSPHRLFGGSQFGAITEHFRSVENSASASGSGGGFPPPPPGFFHSQPTLSRQNGGGQNSGNNNDSGTNGSMNWR